MKFLFMFVSLLCTNPCFCEAGNASGNQVRFQIFISYFLIFSLTLPARDQSVAIFIGFTPQNCCAG